MTPFIPGQFEQCARYGRFITHFLPVCLSGSGQNMKKLRERKAGTGQEKGEEGWDLMGGIENRSVVRNKVV